jgi:hypothetical protein
MAVISAAERHQSVAPGTRAEQFSPRGAKEEIPKPRKGLLQ